MDRSKKWQDYDDLREEQADMEAGFVEEGAEASTAACAASWGGP